MKVGEDMLQINMKGNYIKVLFVFIGVFFTISILGLVKEHSLRRQYENVLADSMETIMNEANIGDTLRVLNESISQKKLYYGNNRYRPNDFQWRYYNAAMAVQKVKHAHFLRYLKNEKMVSKANNSIAEILSSYSYYFKSIYQTMPIVTETNGEEYIVVEGEELEKLKVIEQTTRAIKKIIDDVYSDTSLNKNDMWKVAIERLSVYEPKSNIQ